jgi:hypothetical protein
VWPEGQQVSRRAMHESVKEELAYLQMTRQADYETMEQVRERLIELMHYHQHQLSYRKRTEMTVALVKQKPSD